MEARFASSITSRFFSGARRLLHVEIEISDIWPAREQAEEERHETIRRLVRARAGRRDRTRSRFTGW
jgi:hypothetical protein